MKVLNVAVLLGLSSLTFEGTTTYESNQGTKSFNPPMNISELISIFEPAVYDVIGVAKQHGVACTRPYDSSVTIEIYAFQRNFTLVLKQDRTLVLPDAQVHVVSSHGMVEHEYDFRTLYSGHVAGDKDSAVTGHIIDGVFDGSFYTAGEMFHLEPASRYPGNKVPFHSIIFPSSAVNFNMSDIMLKGQQVQKWYPNQARAFTRKLVSRMRRAAALSNNSTVLNTCPLHLTADHLFLENVGEGSVDKAVAEMLYHTAESDKIFRSTDFNGDGGPGDNIGFTVGAVTVYVDSEAEGPLAVTDTTNVIDFLNKWSSLNHDSYCLALLFTYRDFADGILGLAWVGSEDVGGICSRRVTLEESPPQLMSFNTAVVSFVNFGVRIPRRASVITLAHELGHSFGAEHDPKDSKLCTPGDRGRYIMYPLAVSGSLPNNYLFSACSKESMWRVIYDKGPTCFVAQSQGAYCGNKMMEPDEECDCGKPSECGDIDPCCDPGNFTSGTPTCRVKPENQCSPKKGPCCEYDCMLTPEIAKQICQDETECTYKSTCNGSMAECPVPVSKPTNTTCNGGTNTCLEGACVGPICGRYGLDQCECTDIDQICHVCCKTNEGDCLSSQLLTGTLISKLPGSLCNKYTGYCNQWGQCITVDTDDHMTRLRDAFNHMTSTETINSALKWLKDRWYYVVLTFLCICLVVLLAKKTTRPCDLLVLLRRRQTRPQEPPSGITTGDDNEALEMYDIPDDDDDASSTRITRDGDDDQDTRNLVL